MTKSKKLADVVHFTTGNQKLKYTGEKNGCHIFAFGLPALLTCLRAGDCKQICYARKGNYMFPSGMHRVNDNLAFSKSGNFLEGVCKELQLILAFADGVPVFIRLHDSGDFYSKEYILDWLFIAKEFPTIQFYSYTKSWKLVDECCQIVGGKPANFNYIPSRLGLDDADLGERPCALVVPVGTTPDNLPVGTVMGDKDDIANLHAVMSGNNVALVKH
jgi:hypothetical protein